MSRIFNLTSLLGFLITINTSSALANPIVEKAGFIFEFQGCNISGTSTPLKCDFLVKNTKERRKLFVYADKSRTFDTDFNEITGVTASLGGKEETTRPGTEFLEKTTLKGSITFEKAPVGELTNIDLSCYTYGGEGSFNVEIPLSNQ
jgi:hypothetical protein